MLLHLHIKNFILIEELSLDFNVQGFHVLSGETGAGKSIVIDALLALLGARAQKEWIRDKDKDLLIEAALSFKNHSSVVSFLNTRGFILDPLADEVVIKRVLTKEGKSKAYIAGQLATMTDMEQLGAHLFLICGQSQQQRLQDTESILLALDQFAGLLEPRQNFINCAQEYIRIEEHYRAIEQQFKHRESRLIELEDSILELQEAKIQPGEEAILKSNKQRLQCRDKLLNLLQGVLSLLQDADGCIDQQLLQTKRLLRDLAKIQEVYANPLEQVEKISENLLSVQRSLSSELSKLDNQEESLEQIEQRLSLVSRLVRKYRTTADELEQWCISLQVEHQSLLHADTQLEQIQKEKEKHEISLLKYGQHLSSARQHASKLLSQEITSVLKTLNMPHARVVLDIQSAHDALPSSLRRDGFDKARFLVSTNKGDELLPLDKIASGGEQSRILLSLQSVLGRYASVPVYIFDEVDAGVSGAVGELIGQRLNALGAHHQVICVTHLAQTAAYAHVHLRVTKRIVSDRTLSEVVTLTHPSDKEDEIARMLSGIIITEQARGFAKTLIHQAYQHGQTTQDIASAS